MRFLINQNFQLRFQLPKYSGFGPSFLSTDVGLMAERHLYPFLSTTSSHHTRAEGRRIWFITRTK
ncbi:unnamed protein product, partial [Nesidiocoris tenuis]